jgi:hypothetical protein
MHRKLSPRTLGLPLSKAGHAIASVRDYSTAPQPKQGFIDGYKGLAAQATPLGQTNDLNTRLRELDKDDHFRVAPADRRMVINIAHTIDMIP